MIICFKWIKPNWLLWPLKWLWVLLKLRIYILSSTLDLVCFIDFGWQEVNKQPPSLQFQYLPYIEVNLFSTAYSWLVRHVSIKCAVLLGNWLWYSNNSFTKFIRLQFGITKLGQLLLPGYLRRTQSIPVKYYSSTVHVQVSDSWRTKSGNIGLFTL